MKHFEKNVFLHRIGAVVVLTTLTAGVSAVNDAPLTEKWAPPVWGPEDKAGSVNWTTPETVMQGKV
jgi:hypothetical protein